MRNRRGNWRIGLGITTGENFIVNVNQGRLNACMLVYKENILEWHIIDIGVKILLNNPVERCIIFQIRSQKSLCNVYSRKLSSDPNNKILIRT